MTLDKRSAPERMTAAQILVTKTERKKTRGMARQDTRRGKQPSGYTSGGHAAGVTAVRPDGRD
jgi:hypothetical protein